MWSNDFTFFYLSFNEKANCMNYSHLICANTKLLSSYSFDFNPIETLFAFLKAWICRNEEMTAFYTKEYGEFGQRRDNNVEYKINVQKRDMLTVLSFIIDVIRLNKIYMQQLPQWRQILIILLPSMTILFKYFFIFEHISPAAVFYTLFFFVL